MHPNAQQKAKSRIKLTSERGEETMKEYDAQQKGKSTVKLTSIRGEEVMKADQSKRKAKSDKKNDCRKRRREYEKGTS